MTDNRPHPSRSRDDLAELLAAAVVDPSVFALRPDYRVLLVAVDGLTPAQGDASSEELLSRAEQDARAVLATMPVDELPQVASWRAAYRAFGAKPQRTRNSLEALLRRVDAGLPRVNRLTDVYNAISVRYRIPLGGEDLDRYSGPPRLIRAVGDEPFVCTVDGAEAVERPEPGEVVWCDDAGVTCRRWNWRQTTRTRLRDETTAALFILDTLDPHTDDEVATAGAELIDHLATSSPGLVHARRVVRAP